MHQPSLFDTVELQGADSTGSVSPSSSKRVNANEKEERYTLFGGELIIVRSWIGSGKSQTIFDELEALISWEQPTINVYGKNHLIPRMQAWYGDKGAEMEYSGRRFKPLPWFPLLDQIKKKLESTLNEPFNSVLANLYRDGNDTVGWHADDEKELGKNPHIASISLGQTRTFCLKPIKNSLDVRSESNPKRIDIELHSGDLVLMKGAMQHHWQHSVPRQKGVHSPRINLTFRKILDTTAIKK